MPLHDVGDPGNKKKVAGLAFIATLMQHKYLEGTMEALCGHATSTWTKPATALRRYCQVLCIQLLLWAGMALCLKDILHLERCSHLFHMHADPSQGCLHGVCARESAAWILLFLELRGVHKEGLLGVDEDMMLSSVSCRNVLSDAVKAVGHDLPSMFPEQPMPTTAHDASSNDDPQGSMSAEEPSTSLLSFAATAIVANVIGPKRSLLNAIMAHAQNVDVMEETCGIRKKIEDLRRDDRDISVLLLQQCAL